MAKVHDYYQRDDTAEFVLPEVLMAQIGETIRNPKHVERFANLVSEAVGATTSDVNVRAVVLMAKQQECGDKLAQALASDASSAKVDELLEELTSLRAITELKELETAGLELFNGIDLAKLISAETDPVGRIRIYPESLNDRLDGGARRGHHITVFAPVEAGKTAFCVNANAGFVRQGLKALYIINEDRAEDIILRLISNLSGMTKYEIKDNPKLAEERAMQNGFGNITVANASPGTPRQIEEYIEKEEPVCVTVDQLRNLSVKADTRVNQLEAAATAVRNIGKKTDTLMMSVTQAGDSATGRLVLQTGDIDFSNVGIPAQADVLIGIGMDAMMEAEGLRNISLPKNKISGNHESFPVRIIPQLSRYRSV